MASTHISLGSQTAAPPLLSTPFPLHSPPPLLSSQSPPPQTSPEDRRGTAAPSTDGDGAAVVVPELPPCKQAQRCTVAGCARACKPLSRRWPTSKTATTTSRKAGWCNQCLDGAQPCVACSTTAAVFLHNAGVGNPQGTPVGSARAAATASSNIALLDAMQSAANLVFFCARWSRSALLSPPVAATYLPASSSGSSQPFRSLECNDAVINAAPVSIHRGQQATAEPERTMAEIGVQMENGKEAQGRGQWNTHARLFELHLAVPASYFDRCTGCASIVL